ncbi:ATP-dependent DNA ligase [Scleromatobacter humisilvae]|uniref:DNA ligase (ATP) n=1 Tax=Scleromatobacter humisilvae TaxID=2897159 RepID=A0A9X1YTM3_9BURK|nr:ATP-dependent DNA ligase [Scleromatobacter humisilvae]MCK9689676.1 ATP-dependent DNA ligase [Scleromatobacter humisilvae]
MKEFAALFSALDSTTSTKKKTDALLLYFQRAQPADAAWALYFLAGGKPRQTVPTGLLRSAAREAAGIPEWLFDESYDVVGDLAETIAHVLPPAPRTIELPLHVWIEERLLALRGQAPEAISAALKNYWNELDTPGRFLLTKLIGGSFRVGVARSLVLRALAEATGIDAKLLAQRLMGYTDKSHAPDAARYALLVDPSQASSPAESGQPYPFFLAHPFQAAIETLGDLADWQVEWKWDGIRAQFIRRGAASWLWSRGEDLLNGRFPEIDAMHAQLPDHTVLDGEIVVWRDGRVQPFADLQKRIGRKTVTKKILADLPVAFLAYDLLEADGVDIRDWPQWQRRERLEQIVAGASLGANDPLQISPLVDAPDWPTLAALRGESRARGVEGFMLKQREGRYGAGRTKDVGTWWKWKIDPYSVDAVLIYAQSGHGRRANLYTDLTFGVWDGVAGDEANPRRLVPFAKAYSGLTDDEMRQVDQRIRQTTTEKFGPVRSVTPTLVVELGFEGIQASPRHKSGIAVRFPRMLRLRWDKPVDEADTLRTLRDFIAESAALKNPA